MASLNSCEYYYGLLSDCLRCVLSHCNPPTTRNHSMLSRYLIYRTNYCVVKGVNPWIVLFFNKNLVKTLKETWRTCRCTDRCRTEHYVHQIEEFTSNCEETRYSSQTDIDLINNSTLAKRQLANGERQRSNSNSLAVPNNLLAANNQRKSTQKNVKNGNLAIDCHTMRRRKSSSGCEFNLELSPSRGHSRPFATSVHSPAIEMQTLYTPNDSSNGN